MMSLDKIFRLVAVGRVDKSHDYLWLCPICRRRILSGSPDDCDRKAVSHCLTHSYELNSHRPSPAAERLAI
jgi:hypothetical protein